ncbi:MULTISPECIES: 1,6-anhydro-N-acetylmuramyl-L-alanine amidase AmpD [Vibrio]|uniref:1,6-anhydro-N-acetylmuramyl-L-alanine amidase AmpD n=1 Tax=Vibrio proteolyticus NBRC 13287 TaxID=1219065 RepID=U2ZJ50_VIBPR|nr:MULTISPECIES: 1,6-anhydro-N-acetylmuramyl-L-alanine amidase AmpD [Vibrio]NAW59101.1 1,6-anhydro-N-acetylmuramyl-L-alanine amidase AmpD [Vibrio sp. V36_P2S2PM302]NAX20200.1 1,6-anhydro-N-acetylmuramyl-L-alanine amidase AmpD [Vibrio sp. V39_P1S14PM300]NAX24469.1 1,6-anhydro-N-acetylmuramyl-L-alanine amidase AmpD [Vibrio sp. V38_P2S17PM301]NAX30853.1 1,6-anhydro-N-acetylmuramyl-L-alanine amidase AmpD [Vibrio sp. V37_P2S8PM304]GAD67781.1 1,6-anhydro-N-acetylmuramyl-L-alanine amidase AmpD [Vibri
MIDHAGWYHNARHVPSPFYDQRSDEQDISLLVIHNISLPPGQFGGPYIEQFFTGRLNPDEHPFFNVIHPLRVSAHCLIRRDGEVVQFVPFRARAWHAGTSSFAGRDRCNDYSIGIELEGSDFVAYSDAQYQALNELTQALMLAYPAITLPRITGHQYIAPLRKTDPGLVFDWSRYKGALSSQ